MENIVMDVNAGEKIWNVFNEELRDELMLPNRDEEFDGEDGPYNEKVVEDIVMYLRNGNNFHHTCSRELRQLLKEKGISKKEFSKKAGDFAVYLDRDSHSVSTQFAAYYDGRKRTPDHTRLIEICFILELNGKEADNFLKSVGNYGFNPRNVKDVICYFCLSKHLPYEEINKMMEEYNRVEIAEGNSNSLSNSTKVLKDQFFDLDKLQSMEKATFLKLICDNKQNFTTISKSIIRLCEKYQNLLVKEVISRHFRFLDRDEALMEELLLDGWTHGIYEDYKRDHEDEYGKYNSFKDNEEIYIVDNIDANKKKFNQDALEIKKAVSKAVKELVSEKKGISEEECKTLETLCDNLQNAEVGKNNQSWIALCEDIEELEKKSQVSERYEFWRMCMKQETLHRMLLDSKHFEKIKEIKELYYPELVDLIAAIPYDKLFSEVEKATSQHNFETSDPRNVAIMYYFMYRMQTMWHDVLLNKEKEGIDKQYFCEFVNDFNLQAEMVSLAPFDIRNQYDFLILVIAFIYSNVGEDKCSITKPVNITGIVDPIEFLNEVIYAMDPNYRPY